MKHVRLLLDSHTFYWALWNSPNLSARATQALVDAVDIQISAVSFYELGMKVNRRLVPTFPLPLDQIVVQLGYATLPITEGHAARAAALPLTHRDPWDRILAAQALVEDLTVVTRDPEIAALGARTLW